MTKHVPGKMKVKNGYIIMDGENREELARTLHGIGLYRIISWKEAEANANHIAKAWNCHDELLKVLKRLFSRMCSHCWETTYCTQNGVHCEQYERVERAIANAESEE